jgi:hypothetical protein
MWSQQDADRHAQNQMGDETQKINVSYDTEVYRHAQNWRSFPRHLSGSFDFVTLPLPLLLNSIHLILHEPLRKAMLELKQTPTLAQSLLTSIKVNQ